MSERHQEALAHMLYGMQGEGGVMVLTGEVGTGKTTISKRLLEKNPENTDVAYIINPKQSEIEMLASICDELQISYYNQRSIKSLTDALNQYLLETHAKGRHTVLIIDEAQQLEISVLEQLRLLTNLETNEKKLLQIMLLGQPELIDILARKEMRQLAQRITSRYHLTPLNRQDSHAYINHRLEVAGCKQQNIFPPAIINQLFQQTSGVPRLINLIADRALLGAYALESKQVSKRILNQARLEVLGQTSNPSKTYPPLFSYMLLLSCLAIAVALWFNPQSSKVVAQQTLPVETTTVPEAVKVMPTPTLETAPAVVAQEVNATQTEQAKTEEVPIAPIQSAVEEAKPILPTTASQQAAFIPVFQAWDITYNPEMNGDACAFAAQHQLLCLRQRDNIGQVRNLNLPVVLTVSDKTGNTVYTAITGLKGTTANTTTQNAYAEISLAQLALQSFNDFTLLWKAPQDYQGPVRPGQQGTLVKFLAKQVNQALGQTWIGQPRTVYDDMLKDQIKTLQRQEGLNPDGVAGPMTWIHINRLNHMPSPSLQVSKATR
ncbi:MAG: AAA family ATPase [Ghiorsea sp.]